MRVIVAGSREIKDPKIVHRAIVDSGFWISTLVHGNCRGVDKLAEDWAVERLIPYERFPANWDKYDEAAGPIRNQEMANYADALIAVWDGESSGTKDMIERAQERGLKIYLHNWEPPR